MMAFSLRPTAAASLLSIVAIVVVSVGAFAPPAARSVSPWSPAARSAAASSWSPLRSSPDDDDRDVATTTTTTSSSSSPSSSSSSVSRRSAMSGLAAAAVGGGTTTFFVSPLVVALLVAADPPPALAKLEGVNKPELLPSEPGLNVIQVEKFLTKGQEKRMDDLLTKLEKDTGWRVRVLCQAYPRTPGLAIRDYWNLGKEGQKDDKYVVLVVDEFGGKGNVLNFNVGEGVKIALPNVFWTRLTGKYGTTFFVRENGIDLAITNAIEAIVSCLRSEDQFCVNVPDEGMNLRSLGM